MTVWLLAQTVAAWIIVVKVIWCLNVMRMSTRHAIKTAYWLIGLGYFLIGLLPLAGHRDANGIEAFAHCSIATLLLVTRRRAFARRPPKDKEVRPDA